MDMRASGLCSQEIDRRCSMTPRNRVAESQPSRRGRSDQQWDKVFRGKKEDPAASKEKKSERRRDLRRSRLHPAS